MHAADVVQKTVRLIVLLVVHIWQRHVSPAAYVLRRTAREHAIHARSVWENLENVFANLVLIFMNTTFWICLIPLATRL